MTHKEIIDLWPDRGTMAKDINANRNTVNQWYVRNHIPDKHWKTIIKAARKRRIRLKLVNFLGD